jgi:hypothetical protein
MAQQESVLKQHKALREIAEISGPYLRFADV